MRGGAASGQHAVVPEHMARPISDEELQLRRRARRRLIGAVVLATGLVVVLPMVLDREPRPVGGEINIRIPPPDSDRFTSRVVPVPPSAAPKGGETASAPKFSAAIGEKPSPAAPEARPLPESAPERESPKSAEATQRPPAARSPSAESPAAETRHGEFAVQVVALADAEKVREVRAQIATAGLESYTETVTTKKGKVTRVRTGPYPSRAAAEKARDRLKAAGLPGNVVTR